MISDTSRDQAHQAATEQARLRMNMLRAEELQTFMQTATWQYMMKRVAEHREIAIAEFARANPMDTGRIFEIQKQIAVTEMFGGFVTEILSSALTDEKQEFID